MENQKASIKKNGTTYGTYLGLTLALTTVLCYIIDLSFFVSLWTMLFNFLIILGFGIFSAASTKKFTNGFPTYKQVFTSYTITLALGLLISTIVGILLFNVIDPEATNTIKELSIENSRELMERFGAPEEQIEPELIKLEESEPLSMITQIKNYFAFLTFMLVIGLLVALIFRKKNPSIE